MPTPSSADVWVFGEPVQVRANGRAFPRFKVVDAEVREAQWLVRALRQRAIVFEKVVHAAVVLRPAIATANDPTGVEPMSVRELAEIVGMHESTITRVIGACRFETIHGHFLLTRGKRGIGVISVA